MHLHIEQTRCKYGHHHLCFMTKCDANTMFVFEQMCENLSKYGLHYSCTFAISVNPFFRPVMVTSHVFSQLCISLRSLLSLSAESLGLSLISKRDVSPAKVNSFIYGKYIHSDIIDVGYEKQRSQHRALGNACLNGTPNGCLTIYNNSLLSIT